MRTPIGQHDPATVTTCEYCGDVFAGEYCARCDLYQTISDLSKDLWGVRWRFDYRAVSLATLRERLDYVRGQQRGLDIFAGLA